MDTSIQAKAKRRYRSLEEKQMILAEATAPGASVAAVARKHGVNANLVFAWLRLGKVGALTRDVASPPLLPVMVDCPTLTPTQRASAASSSRRSADSDSADAVEILLGQELRIRLQGQASRELVRGILERVARR